MIGQRGYEGDRVRSRWLILLSSAALALAARAGGSEHASFWTTPVTATGPSLARHDPPAGDLDSASCGACHQQSFEDWGKSLHAHAFSIGLAGQLGAFALDEQRECLNCHAPRAEQQSEWLSGSSSRPAKIDGVDCAACHVRQGKHLGPRAIDETSHGKVEAITLFGRSQFCAACHQFGPEGLALNGKPLENTFAEWRSSRYATAGITCQTCHMPDGRHEFRGIHDPAMTRKGLQVRARRLSWGVEVTATNAGAGHHLPTYATPVIRIDVVSGERRREHVIGRRLAWHADTGLSEVSDTRLAVDEDARLSLDMPPDARASVLVRVDPGHDYHARIYPDLMTAIGGNWDPAANDLLSAAAADARGRAYVLYGLQCQAWNGEEAECRAVP
jgi:nitrate/TMAO reductase-like tetraheme cytochrome c subunit